jgi:hypothetical protein
VEIYGGVAFAQLKVGSCVETESRAGLLLFGDLFFEGLELLGVQLLANLDEHVDVFLLQIAACLGDAIDGGEEPGLVLEIAGRNCGEGSLFALEVGVEREEGGLVGFEDGIHVLLLLGAEAELLASLVVVPPAAAQT